MRNDLIINGKGSTAGGRFDRVNVNGKGTVDGELECETFECNGFGVFNGNVIARHMLVNGHATINSSLDAAKITINGRTRIYGDVAVRNIEINGDAKMTGSLKGEKMKIRGRAVIGGDCEAETFDAGGKFSVEGLLNAEEIFLDLQGKSRAREIGGETIVVRNRESAFIRLLKYFFPASLHAASIEGDNIELENTTAESVKGNKVRIGHGCIIDLVEYKEDLICEDGARVKKKRKV